MKILSGLYYGIIVSGIFCVSLKFNGGNNADPEVILLGAGITFITGFFLGISLHKRKKKQKEEEEARQAEQDRTNELMREYFEKKLREENENGK